MRYKPAKYLIRLDDACPTMNKVRWNRFEALLDNYNIKPIIAVIPDNNDPSLKIDNSQTDFWRKVKEWQKKGYIIALHGYDHVYISKDPGLVPLNNFSEFSGISFTIQQEKIRKGIQIFVANGIKTEVWVAPGHSFDENTLRALKRETDIRIISDGFSYRPFVDSGFIWLPQQLWRFKRKKRGIWTACFHPNTTTDQQFARLSLFLEENYQHFISINDIGVPPVRSLKDSIFHHSFFLLYRLKKFIKRFITYAN